MYLRLFLMLTVFLVSLNAEAVEHGQVKISNISTYSIWDDKQKEWTDIHSFWLLYTAEKGGVTWGTSQIYPQYKKVKEGDTILIKVEQGECLMEFFHQRWRRANDVRRWDEKLNDYSGCPHVFD